MHYRLIEPLGRAAWASSGKPSMFDLLGTPPVDKQRLVYPGGHSVPRVEMIKESLHWLDRYLGSVNAGGS